MSDDLFVCAIGASAGGLSPIEEFFDNVEEKSGIAYVVIQHLSPDHESMMSAVLGRHTSMPVTQAVDGTTLEPDHIYLIPPSTEMTVFGGRLRLRARPTATGSPNHPITLFFNAVASEYADRCAAIVLSGTGSDGAEGIEAVRRSGGFTISQDHTAAFEAMPDAARSSGSVDLTCAPEDMPALVVRFARERIRPNDDVRSLEPPEMRILRVVGDDSGVDFTQYKPSTIHRRIARRVTLTRCDSVEEYLELVQRKSIERELLVEDLLIDVSAFFRDAAAWAALAGRLDDLVADATERSEPLRIWSAATSTGEEAYTLAMLAIESRERTGSSIQIQVFATDVHRTSLAHASLGEYDESRLDGVSADRRTRFFESVEGGWRIRKDVRSMVTFAHHNLLTDAPFTRLDLAVCRNMLIYLRPAAQETALSLLFSGLRIGGVLMLGPSEGPGFLDKDITTLDRSWRIFRKDDETALRAGRRLPSVASAMSGSGNSWRGSPRVPVSTDQRLLRAYDAILESQFVAGLLINANHELVHTFGTATRLMSLHGRPTLDVLQLIEDPVLRVAISSALSELERNGSIDDVERSIMLPADLRDDVDEPIAGTLAVRRLDIGSTEYHLIQLVPRVVEPSSGDRPMVDFDPEAQQEIERLMNDLVYTRESLQTAVEQQEIVNEELNATNEELYAANEELQSTNEELSSVNEELITPNDEHQRQLDSVLELSADLEQMLDSTDIAVVLLNEDGTIRRISQPARHVFKLREFDLGRPFADMATSFDRDRLLLDIRDVARGDAPISRRVEVEGTARTLLIDRYPLPHGTSGVALAVVSVDLMGPGEREYRQMLDAAPLAMYAKDAEGRYIALNPFGAERVGASIGMTDAEVFPADVAEQIRRNDREVVASGVPTTRIERPSDRDGNPQSVLSMKFPLPSGGVGGISLFADEEFIEATSDLGATANEFYDLLESLPLTIDVTDTEHRLIAANRYMRQVSGGEIGSDITAALSAETIARIDAMNELVIESGSIQSEFVEEPWAHGEQTARIVVAFPMGDDRIGRLGIPVTSGVRAGFAELGPDTQRYLPHLDAMPISIAVFDADDRVVATNRQWNEYTGMGIGSSYADMIGPEQLEAAQAAADEARTAGSYVFGIHRNHEGVDHIGFTIPLPDGHVARLSMPFVDVVRNDPLGTTDRERLSAEIERLRALVVDLGGDPTPE